MQDSLAPIAPRYRAWAEHARGRSPLYEELANAAADDPFTLAFLAQLPEPKQQPNLLFGAVKYGWGAQPNWHSFRGVLEANQELIRRIILAHRTQTNEPARCAVLLPLLAMLPQPLALLEIGAAAGLCLIPDRYAYIYNDSLRIPAATDLGAPPPVFSCKTNPQTPLPAKNIEVVWRAGLDLAPIDLRDADSVRWLEALVWPGEGDRLELLRSAFEVARRDPPPVHRGDLRTDLPTLAALAAKAPRNATLVIFHNAVFLYLSPEDRAAVAKQIAALGAAPITNWISYEPREMSPCPPPASAPQCENGEILLAMNSCPVAWADSHGTWIRWFAS